MDLVEVGTRLELHDLYTAYAACLDTDALEDWPDFFTEDCRYRITSAENYEAGMPIGLIYATSKNMKTVERTIGQEHRFTERKDPARRPPGAVPVEFVLLGYPVLDAPPLPGDSGDSDSDRHGGNSDSGDPGAGPGG